MVRCSGCTSPSSAFCGAIPGAAVAMTPFPKSSIGSRHVQSPHTFCSHRPRRGIYAQLPSWRGAGPSAGLFRRTASVGCRCRLVRPRGTAAQRRRVAECMGNRRVWTRCPARSRYADADSRFPGTGRSGRNGGEACADSLCAQFQPALAVAPPEPSPPAVDCAWLSWQTGLGTTNHGQRDVTLLWPCVQ